jgi:hypothetical protein
MLAVDSKFHSRFNEIIDLMRRFFFAVGPLEQGTPTMVLVEMSSVSSTAQVTSKTRTFTFASTNLLISFFF